ncbi:PPM-type phosphatase domain [Trinorchestia longiramus]|nr:PPM-type phosphatase domain [Trinorchestia longiramus]
MTELPPWLSLCEDLKDLELSWNKITAFPPWLPLPSMVRLSLHHNKITELPELEPKTPEVHNSLARFDNHVPYKANTQHRNEDVPPPPPPRMPNMSSKAARDPRVSHRNIPVSISPPLRSHLQNKRQVPPPDGPCLPSFPPPPIPPPPQFLEKSDSVDGRISPPGYRSNESNSCLAPPVPPMPPHLRSRCLRTNVSQMHNLTNGLPVVNKDSASEDEGLYEECGKGSNEYPLEELLLHHNKIKNLPEKFLQMLPNLRLVNVSNNQLVDIPRQSSVTPNKKPDDITANPIFTFNPCSENTQPMLENVEEFYCGCNGLSDLRALERCAKLKVLHAPYNELSLVPDRLIASLPKLEELTVAGNYLHNLPMGIASLQQLRMLRVNCNPLQILPPLSTLPHIKVVDASHCQLGELRLETIIAPSLMILDVSENPSMSVDPEQVNLCRTRKSVSVVDASKDRFSDAPDVEALVDCCSTALASETHPVLETRLNSSSSVAKTELSHGKMSSRGHGSGHDAAANVTQCNKSPWRVGFAECIGRENRQKSLQLRVADLNGDGLSGLFGLVEEAVSSSTCSSKQDILKSPHQDSTSFTLTNCPISSHGLISGHRISDVQKGTNQEETEAPTSVGVMLSEVPRIFQEDLRTEDEEPLKCSMLSALQRQQLRGHLLPYGFSVLHLVRRNQAQQRKSAGDTGVTPTTKTQPVRITVSSYGQAMAMIASTHRTEMLKPLAGSDKRHEVCSAVGSQCCHITSDCPDGFETKIRPPNTFSCDLTADHLAIVIASSGLWKVMQAPEVNQVCARTPDPSLAARRLLTLAQAYGACQSISVMVVSLSQLRKTHVNSSTLMSIGKELPGRKLEISRRSEIEGMKVGQTLKREKKTQKSKIHSGGWNESETRVAQKLKMSLPRKQEDLERNDVDVDKPDLPARSNLKAGQKSKIQKKKETLPQRDQEISKKTIITNMNKEIFFEDEHNDNKLKEKLKRKPRHSDDSFKDNRMMSLPCLSTEVKNRSAKITDCEGSLPLTLDRSSPSGQSFSDLSLIAADEEMDIRGSRAPVWPGQLGPVAPSGPFAMDRNCCEEEELNNDHLENASDLITQFQRRNSIDGTRFKRDRFSMRSSVDSFASNSSKTTRTEQDSVRSSQRSILKKSSVPVFRPFYHFPSPDSIIQLNKTHSGRYSPTLPHAFASRSHLSRSSDRSSLASKKLSIFSKVSPSSSRSLSVLSGNLSDSDSSLNSIEKLDSHFHGRESQQVSEEQLRSFEYMLEKNARTVYLKDLDSAAEIARLRHREKELRLALSVPDLVVAHRRLEKNLKQEKYNSVTRKTQASENGRNWWEVDDNSNYSKGRKWPEANYDNTESENHRREHDAEFSGLQTTLNEKSGSRTRMNNELKSSLRRDAAATQIFQRGVVRKSRFGSGTARVLQHRLQNGTNKINSPLGNPDESNLSEGKEASPEFRRFGSLQNLKQYQKNAFDARNSDKPRQVTSFNRTQSFTSLQSVGSLSSMKPEAFQNATAEMEERRSLDSVELESRMSNYWHANTTVF